MTSTVEPGAASAVEHSSCRYRARAWWGDRLVAESTAAVRAQEPGQAPALYFPRTDVRLDLLQDEGRQVTCPVKGAGELWTLDGKAPAPVPEWHAPGHGGEDDGLVDGRDAVWSFAEPAAGLEWLAGLVAFDHDRVRVELVDLVDGEEPREASIKRFPTWGDAADLIDIMDVRPAGELRYVSAIRPSHTRSVVEASQILGQAIVAAMRHTAGRRAVSAHLVMYRVADTNHPLEFDLEELSSGRTFSALLVHVSQGGRRRATVNLLLDVTAPGVVAHAAPPPPCAGPYDSEPYDMSVTGRDLRFVDAAYDNDSAAPVGPPVIDSWLRFREVPADPALHAGLLAQFTGHISIAAALRPHAGVGQDQAHRTLSMGINAIAISLHADVRADRWMRYHHHSTFAGDGMTHSECRVYTEAGELVASFTVDATLRGVAGRVLDDRTAI
ncbi:thioesterase family protein [Frankia sp. CNm7]|uniref:Thioesterase family protein n=1 Tax=Frankia nepalensis TaxID=1836974 RepID=A0A937URZ7_9ACTN|nr:DUF427 domain-containing protein [Frankia nepalensis]MBL7497288.1 thioesterase family protein [Frankia nepalensis]MBL7515475.1 thioesterase family protein [Frankia nepalensis]MBL7522781.1 thioesterase family protein [Frankia nepalensis]MBL7631907.1 thioesterase family protein [Frankia nepalensis]